MSSKVEGSTPSAAETVPAPPRRSALTGALLRPEAGGAISALLVFIFFAIMAGQNGFLTLLGTANWLDTAADLGIIALPIGMLMIAGEFDLSVGSVVGLSGVLCADVMVHGHGVAAGVLAGVLAGVAVGALNGFIVTRIRIPSFIVTLAMMMVTRGAALKFTDARTISGLPPSFAVFGDNEASIAIIAVVFVVSWIVLTRTPFGRHVYAIGGNADAAWLSGVRVGRVEFAVYVLCGAAAGVAGVLSASRLHVGYPRAGEFAELDSIAAVVVGGTSLFGGRGTIWGTLAGVFFIGVLNNGLNLFNVSPYDQMIAKGAVLAVAASIDRLRRRAT
ncbi:MAG TPA: ABC transporter permease [Thermomicrobiales bacterium]|nr:ABC transporter permease [Thermomicrobiales bacterium]